MAPEGQLFKAHACRGVHHHKDIVRDVEEVKFEIFFVILVMMDKETTFQASSDDGDDNGGDVDDVVVDDDVVVVVDDGEAPTFQATSEP